MTIKTQSAKAKGRKLQQWVVEQIYNLFPHLEEGDARSTSMGANGEDVTLSPAARRVFPYSVECKARASFVAYPWLLQAKANSNGHTPILIVKQDRSPPLVVMYAEDWFNEKQLDGNYQSH